MSSAHAISKAASSSVGKQGVGVTAAPTGGRTSKYAGATSASSATVLHLPPPSGPSGGSGAVAARSGDDSSQTTAATEAAAPKPVDAATVKSNILPLMHDIIRLHEKDNQDVSAKKLDSLEASQKIPAIQKAVEQLRDQIYRLPGTERSKADQLSHLERLKKQLEAKKTLIAKYRDSASVMSNMFREVCKTEVSDADNDKGNNEEQSSDNPMDLDMT